MSDRPNVVFVLTDQFRAHALGCMGNEQVQTPTLDGFARESVVFERGFSNAPVCCPARGSILTGQYPDTHGVTTNNLRLDPDIPTLGECFRDAGYETGYVGKWHLDGEPYPGHIPPGDRRKGFEYWEGFNRGHKYFDGHPQFDEDGHVSWTDGYQPADETDLATTFIQDRAAGDAPFFVFLSWGPPHTTQIKKPSDDSNLDRMVAPDDYRALYSPDEHHEQAPIDLRPNVPETHVERARHELADYYGMVTSLDDCFGRLLDGLETAGVAEDTIVVFTSDHGEMAGSHGLYRKGFPLEESIRVPFLVRHPEALDPERVEAPVSLVDLMPTLLSACGIDVPSGVQGRDLSPLLYDDASVPDPSAVYLGLRYFTDRSWRGIRTDRHLLSVDRELETTYHFDVAEDPYQQRNLAGDSDYADLEASLRERLFDLVRYYDDEEFVPLLDETADPV
jgi:arylsulfatase A-like enzyme